MAKNLERAKEFQRTLWEAGGREWTESDFTDSWVFSLQQEQRSFLSCRTTNTGYPYFSRILANSLRRFIFHHLYESKFVFNSVRVRKSGYAAPVSPLTTPPGFAYPRLR